MGEIVPLLTAFGLGSIVTALIQSWLAQRSKRDNRRFQEKANRMRSFSSKRVRATALVGMAL
jgi:hypothetical protein